MSQITLLGVQDMHTRSQAGSVISKILMFAGVLSIFTGIFWIGERAHLEIYYPKSTKGAPVKKDMRYALIMNIKHNGNWFRLDQPILYQYRVDDTQYSIRVPSGEMARLFVDVRYGEDPHDAVVEDTYISVFLVFLALAVGAAMTVFGWQFR